MAHWPADPVLCDPLNNPWGPGVGGGSERGRNASPHRGFVLRVPLRRHPSLRKKLRAQGQLSEFWKSQNLDLIQFIESCTMDQSANEPLINYLDVRHPGAGAGERRAGLKPGAGLGVPV